MRRAAVFTHRRPEETGHTLGVLLDCARKAGVELLFDGEETRKHGLEPTEGVVICTPGEIEGVDLVVVLGGDGTILTALRRYSGTGVPVYAVNFGEVGFLATVDPDGLQDAFGKAFAREFDLLRLPAITLQAPSGIQAAINDVSIHRKVGERVAMLSYGLQGQELGNVRCDGLVVATPAGSTGYNLANGGPVLAWGVRGFVVSFIAPHSLTARPLVAAPADSLVIENRSRDEPVDISCDGRPAGELGPGEAITCRFLEEAALLAQVPGSTFYKRLREKFGKLV